MKSCEKWFSPGSQSSCEEEAESWVQEEAGDHQQDWSQADPQLQSWEGQWRWRRQEWVELVVVEAPSEVVSETGTWCWGSSAWSGWRNCWKNEDQWKKICFLWARQTDCCLCVGFLSTILDQTQGEKPAKKNRGVKERTASCSCSCVEKVENCTFSLFFWM